MRTYNKEVDNLRVPILCSRLLEEIALGGFTTWPCIAFIPDDLEQDARHLMLRRRFPASHCTIKQD